MNYAMIKLKLKDFEAKELEPLKDESGNITLRTLYKNDLDKKIDEQYKKVNANKIREKISKKVSKKDLTQEEKNKQVKNEVDDVLLKIKSNIKKSIETRIVVRDTELIRIIRALDLDNNDKDDNGYKLINDLICVIISTPIYETIKDGIIEVNKIKYMRLLASSGNVRNKKVIFIKYSLYDKAMDILLCGLPKDLQHKKISKYNAYMGLPNSDTKVVTMPRIVVISDYTLDVKGTYDVVTKHLNGNFTVDPDKEDVLENMPFDGAGLCSLEIAKQWSKDLGLINDKYYIPSSFQFRAIIGLKGNLYTMDIKKYISELDEDKRYITDAWGTTHKVMDDKGDLLIDAILSESQFKFKDYYKSFEEWEDAFETDLHGYKRTFNIAKWGNKKNKEKALLSYQPIQSLQLTDDEIKELCKPTIDVIKDISTNVDSFLKYRGLLEEVINDEGDLVLTNTDIDIIPPYYEALRENKNLFNDDYIQKKVQADIQKFKENASKGMVFVDGNYQTLTIDLVGFMEFATGQEVKGAVPPNQVYSKYWMNKEIKSFEENENVTELDLIRFPHIAQEHCLVSVIQDKIDWFEYIDDGIIVSMFDSNNQKEGSADSDGDRLLNTSSKVMINAVKRQPSNCILFKEEKEENKKPETTKITINNIEELIKCDCRGMDASIGEVVNKTTILWSMPKDEEGKRDEYIKTISVVGALVIDFVKTGVKEDVPSDIIDFIEGNNKPKFLKVKYKKIEQKQNRINKNHEIFGETKEELFSNTDCTMNRLYDHVNAELEKIKLDKPIGKFDFTSLMKYKKLNIRNETYPLVVAKLIELKQEHDEITQKNSIDSNTYSYDSDKQMEKVDKYKYFYKYCKNELININKECKNKDKLLDYVIYTFYADVDFALKNDDKSLLWNVFDSELNTRLSNRKFRNKEFDKGVGVDELQARREKLLEEKDKAKEKAKRVMIKGIDDVEEKDIKVTEFPKDNIFKQIDKIELSGQANKVLKVLVMLDVIFKIYGKELLIQQAKKGNLSRNIIAKLTGLNITKIDGALKELNDGDLIKLEIKSEKDKETLKCKISMELNDKGNKVKLKGSDSIAKVMKKLTLQK